MAAGDPIPPQDDGATGQRDALRAGAVAGADAGVDQADHRRVVRGA
jgi:hypothetical protein